MSEISSKLLESEIHEILKDADLTVITVKKVRLQLEKKLGRDLNSRRKEIDSIVMDFVNAQKQQSDDELDDEENNKSEEDEDEAEIKDDSYDLPELSAKQLENEIHNILKDTDLSVMTVKKVRQQLQKKLGRDLNDRRKEIDAIVMEFVNAQKYDESEDDGEDEDVRKNKYDHKSKKEESSESDGSEYGVRRTRKRAASSKSKHLSGKRKKSEATKKKSKGEKKETGYLRAYTLSPELANLMGADVLPRHEVVKKMWAMIKERNLYDPKNKQYAICDSDLFKVIGIKRFRTFGMLKYLKTHFLD